MQIKVTQNEVKINKDILNDGEYNIHKCQFDFDEEYNGLVQKAVFSLNDGTPYLMTIVNNECNIPIEVLEEGVLKIGVYAYETNNDELVLRYSPSPDIIHVFDGSYVKDAQNTEPVTPTDKEQIEQNIANLQNDVNDLEENKQDALVSGENIKTINGESVLGSGNIEIDLSNYYNKQEIDQSQASQNTNITKNTNDIATLNNKLINYSLITETGSQIALNINSSNYQMTAILKDKNGNTIYTSNVIDLPIESMIVNVTYDSTTKEIVFTLQNGTTLRVSVADLVSGLVSTDELNTILASYYTKTEIDNLLSEKVDTTTYTQGQATQDANIEENASNIDWLQTLVNQMPTVSGQGTDLSLESVLNYRLMKFLPQGVSKQGSTTGANILNNINYSLGNIDATGQDISSGNTYRFNEYIPINEQTTIYLLKRLVAVYYDENKEYISQTSSGSLTLTTPAGTKYARFRTFAGDFNTFNNTDYMVSLSSITSYEPYTGGIPAPNPDYPYPVKSVTGENSLVICNENLLNIEDGTYSASSTDSRSITFKDGVGTPNFTSTSSALYIAVSCNLTLKAGTYTLQGFTNSSYPYIQLRNGTTIIVATVYGDNNKKTFTLSEDAKIDNVRFYYGSSLSNIGVVKPMIVKGENISDVFTSYQEQNYQLSLGNIELNSSPDGTIRDYIYGTPDNWVKREYIGKVVLDGSEDSWTNQYTGAWRVNISNLKMTTATSDSSNVVCNYYKTYTQEGMSGNNYGICNRANQSQIIIKNIDYTSITDFKAWLSTHNTIVWYQKAQYTDIPITDTTLISQLNDIYNNAHSYNGVTNITTTYEGGNEQMYLDIEALKNVWEMTE